MKIGFFGGGKMAHALAKGFIKAGLKGDSMVASCLPSDLKSKQAFETIGSKVVFLNKQVADHGDVLIISVKPQVVNKILPEIKNSDKLILSIAAAYKLATQTVLGAGAMVNHHQSIGDGCHPAQLKDDVASPAGSTIMAIHHLEKYGMRSAVIGAIEVATLACRAFSKKQ
ncbi:hypothetical protein G9C98_004416 [Cotesia typhae]|uniref:Pyrroline-5-carboxylate reductase catalytic N-terminal domain-containing protein n=1 Tax=Cotesia typhae TaxID=2053667 RepID=A0A8J5R3X6_9HYME|nr:hypothetical protein G9C98_004416 [Cotesia typhae]